jgi:hypothetical protein
MTVKTSNSTYIFQFPADGTNMAEAKKFTCGILEPFNVGSEMMYYNR